MSIQNPYSYQESKLHFEYENYKLNLLEFAKKQEHPFYIYNLHDVETRFEFLKSQLNFKNTIHYAVKANCHPQILGHLKKLGAGADVVSAGEIKQALNAGFDAKDVIFSGVGKSKAEITFAIEKGIKQINVESLPELQRIVDISKSLKKPISVALRLNPDVNPVTHPYITTGFRENKFGMESSQVLEGLSIIKKGDFVDLNGITLHIGSQLLELSAMGEAIDKSLDLCKLIEEQGFKLKTLDVGGGVGVHYSSSDISEDLKLVENYTKMLREKLGDCPYEVLLEPGRVIVARSGLLIGQVQYIKETQNKTFVILDTGMNHLMRPSLYQAFHNIVPLIHRSEKLHVYDIVGPICESADFFGKDRPLSEVHQDDYLAVADAGAYGAVMANNYNAHGLPQEFVWYRGELISST